MELEKHGIMMPVVSVNARYHTPARMGDVLRVVSRVEKEPMARIEVLTDIPPPCWKCSAKLTWNRLLQKKINNNEKICLHFCF